MNDNVNGVFAEPEPKPWEPEPWMKPKERLKVINIFFPLGKEDGRLDIYSYFRSYPSCIAKDLQQGCPMVKSTLEKCDISCKLELDTAHIIFRTKSDADPDTVVRVETLLHLLSERVLVPEAVEVMDGKQWDIILTGDHRGGHHPN